MLLLHAQNIKKYYGDRLILDIEDLKIYSGDKIGIVGVNGAGKTTLLEILTKNMVPDEGTVKLYTDFSYIKQFGVTDDKIDGRMAREFEINNRDKRFLSGGEQTRLRIAGQLSKSSGILFADEPTCNLDMEGILLVEKKLMEYDGALLLISHDRELLDKVCNHIIEIENGKIRHYSGNYSDYKKQKEAERQRHQLEYDKYISERKKLEAALNTLKVKAARMKKAPKRMGNSEARLHKRSATESQEKLHSSIKAIRTRLEKLEVKEKPRELDAIKMKFQPVQSPASRVLISGKDISLSFGNRVLFDGLNFEIPNGSKTALVGKNGVGKTTLIKMILSRHPAIKIAEGVRIGYFSQDLDILDPEQSILDNIMKESYQPEWMVRTILAGLLFKRDDVYKKVAVLSGGEKVKASIAKLLVSDANLLILDEPTNYLDVFSMDALQSLLMEYKGTVLLVSHDRWLVDRVADRIIVIENCKAKVFNGTYTQYLDQLRQSKNVQQQNTGINIKEQEMILRMRLAEITGRLFMPGKNDNVDELEMELKQIVSQLKQLQK
nr:MAG: ABC-F type ribosomal protection protein [Caldicoprobacter oshimai]